MTQEPRRSLGGTGKEPASRSSRPAPPPFTSPTYRSGPRVILKAPISPLGVRRYPSESVMVEAAGVRLHLTLSRQYIGVQAPPRQRRPQYRAVSESGQAVVGSNLFSFKNLTFELRIKSTFVPKFASVLSVNTQFLCYQTFFSDVQCAPS